MTDDRRLPGVEVLHRARAAGYRGGTSALYEPLRRLRPVSSVPVVRFEGVPGEFSQHDFGEVIVRYVPGPTERLRFFASRLKWSRFAHVVVVTEVAGFKHVPEPLPMRNSKGTIVYYLVFASQNTTGGKIVNDIFRKYR